ncbi:allantoate amidohydrolase [Kribbella solani]|uniref:allantoate amidohydrolase n=1 Tax=Kribbella solani TaxID=236067 RepID=UPI0029A35EAF|nr:allantoate amidohydrolase [Kribbella solani]MDX2968494.1 allantoate amidohydrolase [Kribbella solani]MDX3003853.1 allantoate amidohydrolase [Kribbella solani]
MSFESLWADQSAIGRHPETGGYTRGGWTPTEREATHWFLNQCATRDLTVESDGIGNHIAWWEPRGEPVHRPAPRAGGTAQPTYPGDPGSGAGASYAGAGGDAGWSRSSASPGGEPAGGPAPRPGVVTGSHLDSVIDGGAFDGPLGVVSALAAVDRLRAEGFEPGVPIGIGAFVEEEGSRFGMPCLGSRIAAGILPAEKALRLTDRTGVELRQALEEAGIDPAGVGPSPLMQRMGTFVELHVEQGRGLTAPVGVASSIWPHGRYRFTFTGEANHAGTTLMEDRHDPMLTYAMTALAANKQARLAGARATFGRVAVEPNGTNAIPSQVTAWLDARAADTATLESLLAAITKQSTERAERDGTTVEVTAESVSPIVDFPAGLRDRLSGVLADVLGGAPVLPTGAGHDAGVFSAAGIPTAMLFVRNPTGVSHSPAEYAEPDDCLAGVEALAAVLKDLAK